MNMVIDYVESLLYQTSSLTTLEDSDAVGMVSGCGGVLIDAVIYLLPPSKSIGRSLCTVLIPVRPGYSQGH
jgi:hypothetical protein